MTIPRYGGYEDDKWFVMYAASYGMGAGVPCIDNEDNYSLL